MLIDCDETVGILRRIVARAAANVSLREDLMQEALVHLWQQERQHPGQRKSWYLQSCRYHLQNYLHRGCSVDSSKHRALCLLSPGNKGIQDSDDETPDGREGVFAEVSAMDMRVQLTRWLTPLERRILALLMQGFSLRETAFRLHLSHTTVAKHRRRMALVAGSLGIGLPEGASPRRNRWPGGGN
jgi:DNA-binding CsgD family transcriptional regulator